MSNRSIPQQDRPLRVVKTNESALLPQNAEAEAGVLGSLLIDPDKIADVRALLAPDCFYVEDNRLVCQYAYELADQGIVPDLITLPDALERSGKMDGEHARAVVFALCNQVPSSANVLAYAQIVKRDYLKRELIRVGGEIAGVAYREEDVSGALAYSKSLVEQVATDAHADGDDEFVIMSDLEAEAMQPAQGIIGDILVEDTVAFGYAPPGRWKSFVATAMGMSVQTGTPFFGKPVRQGNVVYIASEGARGLGKRIHAWKRRHGFTGQATGMHIIGTPINLLDPECVQRFITRIEAKCANPDLVIVDTLARSMPGGDENSTKDANAAFDGADTIRRAFGCCVFVIHHTGKDGSRGMRGNSAFLGNADTVLRFTGGDDKTRIEVGECITIVSEKAKDGEPFADIHITTEVERWMTDDGESVTSLVVTPYQGEPPAPKPARINPNHSRMLFVLSQSPTGYAYSTWLDQSQQAMPDLTKNKFNYGLSALVDSGQVQKISSPMGDIYQARG